MNTTADRIEHALNTACQAFELPKLERLRRHPLRTLWHALQAKTLASVYYRLPSFEVRTRMFTGDRISVFLPALFDIFVYGTYADRAEVNLMRYMIRRLGPGKTCFDIGANIGFYSVLAARLVGPEGRVIAFEPSPSALPILRRNLEKTPVEIEELALSDRSGRTEFFVGPAAYFVSSSLEASHLDQTGVLAESRRIEIDCMTLDAYCADRGFVPDLIKLDVEGGEPSVLRGASETLRSHAIPVVMEVSYARSVDHAEEAVAILKDYGYLPNRVDENGGLVPLDDAGWDAHAARVLAGRPYNHELDNLVFLPDRVTG